MDKKKKYIPPKCVDLSLGSVAWAQETCTTGSAPSNQPCWNGGAPTGWEGECATGTTPSAGSEGGVCAEGTTPNTSGPGYCDTGSEPQSGGTCVGGTTPS